MKSMAAILGLLVLAASAPAEEFSLVREETGKEFGPFEYRDGGTLVVDGKTYTLKKTDRTARLERKLKELIVPTIDFRGAPIQAVVEFLRAQSVRLDPAGTGVNLVLQLPEPARPAPPQITLSLERIPLYHAIHYVCLAAGLQYEIQETAVLIQPKE